MARTTFLGTVRNGITNLMGGVRGYQNLAAWGVAFTTAYFLWVKPELDLKREQEVRFVFLQFHLMLPFLVLFMIFERLLEWGLQDGFL